MKTLFVCKGNSFRSQIAEAIYNKLTNSRGATSAGTYAGAPDEPEGSLISTINKSTEFVDFMQEKGFDLHARRTVRLTPQMLADANVVISMAEEPWIPDFLKQFPGVITWNVPDIPSSTPKEDQLTEIKRVYNQIESLIRTFIGAE